MAQMLEDVPKTLTALGTSVGSTWKLITDVQGHFALRNEIREKSGQQGLLFFLCYSLFQYIYQFGLVVIAAASTAAFLGGALKALDLVQPTWVLVRFYERHAIQLVLCALLWCAIAIGNGFSWLVLALLSPLPPNWFAFRRSADWYNLKQFVMPLQNPRPLFLNQSGVERLADGAARRLLNPDAGAPNFAAKPLGLTDDERANTALFGCLIEKEHTVQN